MSNICAPARLRTTCGRVIHLESARWWARPGPEEHPVLSMAMPATLDVGCGPARHTLALMSAGVPAVGLDNAGSVVREARRRGAQVIHRSVFDPLPGEGEWGSVLLLDGNVGIGGDPMALFRRVRRLLRTGGRALIEVEAPGVATERLQVRAEHGLATTDWFAWARVGADHVGPLADRSGFCVQNLWSGSDRWFARLDAA